MKRLFTLLAALLLTCGLCWAQTDYSEDYTGNITLSTDGGSNASACVIAISGTNYDGIKAGTSSKVGAVMITVPSGTKYLHLHAAAWNNTTASLAVTPTGYSDDIELTANSGIANNSPFTFNGDASTEDYYKVITFDSPLTADTDLTFTAVGGKRFVIWGVTAEADAGTPSISANNVEIDYDVTAGEISYTINNPVTGTTLTASTDSDWLNLGDVEDSSVLFYCDPNQGAERTATVTLTYGTAATKTVTVTQAGNPNMVNVISDITATGNYIVEGTIVAMSNRGFVLGDGTGYVYYYDADFSSNYGIGDIVKISGAIKVYGGVYEFDKNASIEEGDDSSYDEEEPLVLSGEDMDARVASTTPPDLSTYVQYVGTLAINTSGTTTHYNITDIEGAQIPIPPIQTNSLNLTANKSL